MESTEPMRVGIRPLQVAILAASVAALLGTVGLLQAFWSTHKLAKSSEAGFISLSPRGAAGGAIVPASCESGLGEGGVAHFAGDTSGTCYMPTASLFASPTQVDNGQASTLTWSSTHATSCAAAGGFSTGGATSGSVSTGALTQNVTYQVTCTNATGTSAPAQTTIVVVNPTAIINISPDRVNTGGTITVSWSATNVNSCTITKNGATWKTPTITSRATSGSATDTITNQVIYAISCNNGGTGATATHIANVVSNFQEF